MKIGIDISQIVYEGSGVARFTHGLVRALLMYERKHDWTFFFSALRRSMPQDIQERITSAGHAIVQRKFPPRVLSFVWNRMHIVPVDLLIGKMDWFVTSDWTEPPTFCKKATIVHDLVFRRYPETVHAGILRTQQMRLNWVTRESDLIITDSQSTASDLSKYYDLGEERTRIIYPGVDAAAFAPLPKKILQQVQERYKLPAHFILTVGKIEPRKNIHRLIQAFHQMSSPSSEKELVHLVVVGADGWGDMDISSHPRVHVLGYVPDDDLKALYRLATCFVYPSLYEGFGYPVVEAMLSDCPVLTSNSSSLAEIGVEGSAYLFDPTSVSSIHAGLEEVLRSASVQQKLRTQGARRAQDFTWRAYVMQFVSALEDGR